MLDRQGDLFGLSPPAEVPLEIVGLFEKFALELIASGIDRYSARAIFHRIRWHFPRGKRRPRVQDEQQLHAESLTLVHAKVSASRRLLRNS